jgi:2-keto-3-deoxy-L-rhamnonate aldolase RhmA
MVETPEAVGNVREIASVPGIDAVLVGSSDLTQAMGMPRQAEVDAAIDKVIEGAKAAGKAVGVAGAGMTVNNIARFQHFASRGVQLLSANVQEFIRKSGAEFLDALR